MSTQARGGASTPVAARALLLQATHATTTFGGRATVWRTWGQGEPLVLLHGASGSWMHWIRNIAVLVAHGRKVVVPDMPGFGDSDLPADGDDIDALAEPLSQGLRDLDIGREYDLAGFSLGSVVASLLALREGPRVRRLVLVAPPALMPVPRPVVGLESWRHLKDPAEQAAANRRNLARLMLYREESITAEAVALQMAHAGRDRLRKRKIARTEVPRKVLESLTCPISVIYGREDVMYREQLPLLQQTAEALGIDRIDFIADAGHWVQYEESQRFNGKLLAHLGQ